MLRHWFPIQPLRKGGACYRGTNRSTVCYVIQRPQIPDVTGHCFAPFFHLGITLNPAAILSGQETNLNPSATNVLPTINISVGFFNGSTVHFLLFIIPYQQMHFDSSTMFVYYMEHSYMFRHRGAILRKIDVPC